MYLISHFLNEALLLPYWLKHHVPVFDHGIMIDYGSTDGSVDIIRQLAPHWEIRKTKVEKFEEPLIGDEVQEIEEELPAGSWKVVLNTTEFLLCDDLRRFIQDFQVEFPDMPGFRTNGVLMIDSVEEQHLPLTDESLLLQKRHGLVERRGQRNPMYAKHGGFSPARCRFVHKMPRGHYSNGRHGTMAQLGLRAIDRKFNFDNSWWDQIPENWANGWQGLDPAMNVPKQVPAWLRDSWNGVHPEIFTCWFGRFCPFEAIKERTAFLDYHVPRKSFINGKIPERPDDTSLLEQELTVARNQIESLWSIPAYQRHIEALKCTLSVTS